MGCEGWLIDSERIAFPRVEDDGLQQQIATHLYRKPQPLSPDHTIALSLVGRKLCVFSWKGIRHNQFSWPLDE